MCLACAVTCLWGLGGGGGGDLGACELCVRSLRCSFDCTQSTLKSKLSFIIQCLATAVEVSAVTVPDRALGSFSGLSPSCQTGVCMYTVASNFCNQLRAGFGGGVASAAGQREFQTQHAVAGQHSVQPAPALANGPARLNRPALQLRWHDSH